MVEQRGPLRMEGSAKGTLRTPFDTEGGPCNLKKISTSV